MPETKIAVMTWSASVLIGLLLVSLVVSCGAPVPQPRPLPQAKIESCADACEALRAYGCELGEPTKRGKTCESLCENSKANAVPFISCVDGFTSCEAAERCE